MSYYIDYQPEISAIPAPRQPMQAPIHAPYQSVRLLPPLPENAPATSQPFLGFSSLAPPSSTRHANQARLSSASATIPRQPQVQSRSRTARRGATGPSTTTARGGRATLPRLLNGRDSQERIEDCLVVSDAHPPSLRIQARVLPPMVSIH
jgi:hypothetical protein